MVLDELAAELEAQGVGVRNSTMPVAIFLVEFQPLPDRALVLVLRGGLDPIYQMGGTAIERPAVQTVIRDRTFVGAMQLAMQADAVLRNIVSRLLSGVWYRQVLTQHPPTPARQDDEHDREFVTCNYIVEKEYS